MATRAQLKAAMAPLSADALAKALADTINSLSSILWWESISPITGKKGMAHVSGNYLDLRKMSRTELQVSVLQWAKWMDESQVLQKMNFSSNLLLEALQESTPKPPFWPWVLGGVVVYALWVTGEKA